MSNEYNQPGSDLIYLTLANQTEETVLDDIGACKSAVTSDTHRFIYTDKDGNKYKALAYIGDKVEVSPLFALSDNDDGDLELLERIDSVWTPTGILLNSPATGGSATISGTPGDIPVFNVARDGLDSSALKNAVVLDGDSYVSSAKPLNIKAGASDITSWSLLFEKVGAAFGLTDLFPTTDSRAGIFMNNDPTSNNGNPVVIRIAGGDGANNPNNEPVLQLDLIALNDYSQCLTLDGSLKYGAGRTAKGDTTDMFVFANNGIHKIKIRGDGVLLPVQAYYEPGYIKGGVFFDTRTNQLFVGGTNRYNRAGHDDLYNKRPLSVGYSSDSIAIYASAYIQCGVIEIGYRVNGVSSLAKLSLYESCGGQIIVIDSDINNYISLSNNANKLYFYKSGSNYRVTNTFGSGTAQITFYYRLSEPSQI
jgi:hypothetical protein